LQESEAVITLDLWERDSALLQVLRGRLKKVVELDKEFERAVYESEKEGNDIVLYCFFICLFCLLSM